MARDIHAIDMTQEPHGQRVGDPTLFVTTEGSALALCGAQTQEGDLIIWPPVFTDKGAEKRITCERCKAVMVERALSVESPGHHGG